MSKPTYFVITHVSLMCHLSSKFVHLHMHIIIGVKLDLSHNYDYKLYICIVCLVENVDEKWAHVIHYWWHPLMNNNLVVFPIIVIYFSNCTKMTIQTWHAHIFSYWNQLLNALPSMGVKIMFSQYLHLMWHIIYETKNYHKEVKWIEWQCTNFKVCKSSISL